MIKRTDAFQCLHFLFTLFPTIASVPPRTLIQSSSGFSSTASQIPTTLEEAEPPTDAADVFRGCGCTDAQISTIFSRQPSLHRSKLNLLQSKVKALSSIGLVGSDLVKIITCRPRFLSCRFDKGLDQRLTFLESFFSSREKLIRVIVRNPSLLNYDPEKWLKPCLALYDSVGVTNQDVANILPSRPTIIARSSLNEEKLKYIRGTGLSNHDKLYKHVVAVIAVSRLETICEKVSAFEKFGMSFEEVMNIFGRSPSILTYSVDKINRNMVYITGTMKLPASSVIKHPFLLTSNLETVLRPRFLLAEKIQAMGLLPQIKGEAMIRALRMKEPRFIRVFVTCHEKSVAEVLMEIFLKAKDVKRLAQDYKVVERKGFPF
ncbi:transcription termination factor MTERF2, chloroplastic [Aristolochia californica]|uniref:transcription termination factor MTERF2, chloroplastic n=1 Tax=Aristolochia californica TaxID=171875 RepID=UPI0035DE22B0